MAFGILCVRSENGYDLTAMADDHRDALTMLRKGLGSKAGIKALDGIRE